jgi:hypothetical protein
MPDDHSKVEPLLPIPNRTVKRFCADDSEHYACESRLLSGFYAKTRTERFGFFFAVMACNAAFAKNLSHPMT